MNHSNLLSLLYASVTWVCDITSNLSHFKRHSHTCLRLHLDVWPERYWSEGFRFGGSTLGQVTHSRLGTDLSGDDIEKERERQKNKKDVSQRGRRKRENTDENETTLENKSFFYNKEVCS